MTTTIILGDGGLGGAVQAAFLERVANRSTHDEIRILGRPRNGRHERGDLAGADLVVEASRADAVVPNLASALEAGAQRAVIATTGWQADRGRVESLLAEFGAAAVGASNFSLGVVLFGRLVETAVSLFGPLDGFDP